MNPQERHREFVEKMRQENPRLARKYEAYLEKKKSLYTGDDGYREMGFEETVKSVSGQLTERGIDNTGEMFDLDSEELARTWRGYLEFRKEKRQEEEHPDEMAFRRARIPYHGFDKLGIKSLTDLVDRYSQYAKDRKGKEITIMGFTEELLEELKRVDPEIIEKAGTPDMNLIAKIMLFPGSDESMEMEANDGTRYRIQPDSYYRKQYQRLERENNLHTSEAEEIFTPLLKNLMNVYENIHRGIMAVAKVEFIPLTFGEVRELAERAGSVELQSFIEDKGRGIPDDKLIPHPFAVIMSIDPDIPKENVEEIKENMSDSTTGAIESGIFEELEKLMKWSSAFKKDSEIEKRIRKVWREHEEILMDAPPEIARDMRKTEINYRFALYLFGLARRRRSELPSDPFEDNGKVDS